MGDEAGRFEDGGSGRDVTTSEEESAEPCISFPAGRRPICEVNVDGHMIAAHFSIHVASAS